MVYSPPKDNPVQFNLGLKVLEMIGLQLSQATNAYNNKRFSKCFSSLKSVKIIIIARLVPQERTILENQEKKIDLYLGHIKPTGLQYPDKNESINNIISKGLSTQVEIYHTLIQELLEKKGYLIPSKRDRSNLFGQDGSDDFEEEGEQ